MADEIEIPGLEGIDLTQPEDTRPDWFSGDEIGEDDPAFKEIVEKMAEAGMEIPEGLDDPTPLPSGKEADSETPEPEPSEDKPGDTPDLPPVYDESAPAPDADADTGDEPSSEPLSDRIDVEIDGQTYAINQEQAAYLLQMNSWIEQVPDAVKQQWAGIQDGTHVAITQEQLAAFKTAQQAPPPPSPNRVDLDSLDDETAEYIRELEAKLK